MFVGGLPFEYPVKLLGSKCFIDSTPKISQNSSLRVTGEGTITVTLSTIRINNVIDKDKGSGMVEWIGLGDSIVETVHTYDPVPARDQINRRDQYISPT